jgi:hypothetical protein
MLELWTTEEIGGRFFLNSRFRIQNKKICIDAVLEIDKCMSGGHGWELIDENSIVVADNYVGCHKDIYSIINLFKRLGELGERG